MEVPVTWTFESDKPIYGQIVERIKFRIVKGEYPPGSRIPSVRELALEAGVNPNTVQRAYAELESEGVLYTERTNGKFVVNDSGLLNQLKQTLSRSYIEDLFQKLTELGLTKEEIIAAVLAEKE